MRLESQQSSIVLRVGGLAACAVALVLIVATGGAALIPALLLALGGRYAWRTWVEAVSLSAHARTLTVTHTRLFASATQSFPLPELTARYQVRGGLRSAKYHTLAFRYQERIIAELNPKEGYSQAEIERFHATFLASQAAGTET